MNEKETLQWFQFVFWLCVNSFIVAMIIIYLNSHGDHERTRWQRFSSWFLNRYFPQLTVMSNEETEDDEETAEIEAEINNKIVEIPQQVGEILNETFSFSEIDRIEAEVLARLVISETIGITDAVKIGMQAKSGERYQRKTKLLQAEIERQKQRYRPLTQEQQEQIVQLGLARK